MAVVGYIDGYVDENNNEHGLTDTVAQGLITAIKDGSSIDSFGDVETALADKPSKANVIANTQLIADTVGFSGKNKCPYPNGTRQVISGTGAISDDSGTYLSDYIDLKGITTLGFSAETITGTVYIRFAFYDSSKTFISRPTVEMTTQKITQDVLSNARYVRVCFEDNSSNKMTNPMLYDADILDSNYEPYRGTTAFPRDEQAVLGAKNLLPINVASGTSNGITWVVNSDKSVTVYGTATARVDIALIPTKAEILKDFLPYVGKTLIINGCPSGGTVATGYWISAQGLETDGIGANDVGNGASFTVHDFTNYQTVGIRISIANGVNMGTEANPKVFKPMVRFASDPDSTYVPYAMTNRELTEKIGGIDYSTTEQDTGIKWLDGKTIYQKTFDVGALPNTSTKNVSVNVANINEVIKLEGIAITSSKYSIPLPDTNPNDNTNATRLYYNGDSKQISVQTGMDRSAYNGYVTIYYTKTS